MKKTPNTALVVGDHFHDPLGLRLSIKTENSNAITAVVEGTYKYMIKSITECHISISGTGLSDIHERDHSPDRYFEQELNLHECHASENALFWGHPLHTVDYMTIYLQSANELACTLAENVSFSRNCKPFLDNCSLAATQPACSDLQRWGEKAHQYLSPEKKSRKSKSGKLQKKPKRDIEDAIADLELHIQKNHDLFESWFSLARQVVIDDGGALAGNKRKRHIS